VNLTRVRSALDRLVDPLLALALLAFGIYEVWIESGQVAGPRLFNTAFLLLATVPLAWRRRRPLAVLAIVALASSGWNYAFYVADQPPLTPFLALLLAAFSVAATTERATAVIGGALVAAWILSTIPALVSGTAAGDVVPAWIFATLAWAIGRVVHRQRALASALAERASQLEQEREEKARLAVALERARIARELHDVVTHNVSVIVVQAGVERRALGAESEPTREVLGSIEQIGRATLVELRRLLGVLRKGEDALPLAPQPTLERLDDLVAQAGEAGVPTQLQIEGARVELPAGVELSAYRIVQEALTNVLKHAGPARATVVVRYGGEALELEIADDGRPPGNGAEGGHGLVGMRERVALHGGTLETASRNGAGFVVRARLPLTGS
jgi:signal transduction histidine kinase